MTCKDCPDRFFCMKQTYDFAFDRSDFESLYLRTLRCKNGKFS